MYFYFAVFVLEKRTKEILLALGRVSHQVCISQTPSLQMNNPY